MNFQVSWSHKLLILATQWFWLSHPSSFIKWLHAGWYLRRNIGKIHSSHILIYFHFFPTKTALKTYIFQKSQYKNFMKHTKNVRIHCVNCSITVWLRARNEQCFVQQKSTAYDRHRTSFTYSEHKFSFVRTHWHFYCAVFGRSKKLTVFFNEIDHRYMATFDRVYTNINSSHVEAVN